MCLCRADSLHWRTRICVYLPNEYCIEYDHKTVQPIISEQIEFARLVPFVDLFRLPCIRAEVSHGCVRFLPIRMPVKWNMLLPGHREPRRIYTIHNLCGICYLRLFYYPFKLANTWCSCPPLLQRLHFTNAYFSACSVQWSNYEA